MKKLLLILFLFSFSLSKSVDDYVNDLKNLDKNQSMTMVASYWAGSKEEFGLTLMAIVWKESSFGKNIANSKDGKYGSFGVGQILLETAMARLNKKGSKARKEMKMKLLTDMAFNLNLAVQELVYWRNHHKDKKKRKYWLSCVIASYNAGWKSLNSKKGMEYSKDVLIRVKALKKYFRNLTTYKYKVTEEHLKDIQADMKNKNMI